MTLCSFSGFFFCLRHFNRCSTSIFITLQVSAWDKSSHKLFEILYKNDIHENNQKSTSNLASTHTFWFKHSSLYRICTSLTIFLQKQGIQLATKFSLSIIQLAHLLACSASNLSASYRGYFSNWLCNYCDEFPKNTSSVN